jgi:uncharacterized protein YcaQ
MSPTATGGTGSTPFTVPPSVARRFILGQQGLWPGRRWRSPAGVALAVRQTGSIQVDPLDVVGHSHDLALLGRVEGYLPAHLDRALYRERSLFEWGGAFTIRPIEQLPYWRFRMEHMRRVPRWAEFARRSAASIAQVRSEIEREGPRSSRDLAVGPQDRVVSYRAGSAAALALYYLWLVGEVMIRERRRGEKVYDLTSRLLPARLVDAPDESVALDYLALEGVRAKGLASSVEVRQQMRGVSDGLQSDAVVARWLARWQEDGRVVPVRIEGWPGTYWITPESRPDLDSLARGEVPRSWRPIRRPTEEEAVLLAPLDAVSAHGRAKRLFGFDYLWEVYKPAHLRRWGYYVLPVLYREGLPARVELRRDVEAGRLQLIGLWFERMLDGEDASLGRAIGRGLARLARMNGLHSVEVRVRMTARSRVAVSEGAAEGLRR